MSPLFPIGLLGLLVFISFATYRTGQLLRAWQPEENLLLSPFENVARLGIIALCFGLGALSGRGAAGLGWLPAQPLADIGLGVAVGLGLSLALLPLNLWVRRYRPHWYSDVVMQAVMPRTAREWSLVILAFLPTALLEELLFRSLLLGGFAPYVNVIYFAVAVSLFFGLLHLPQGEWGVVGVTLVALALSALFLWRQSLLLVVVAHWVANIAQLGQAWWMGRQKA